jgi:hypothetical protein
MLLFCRHSSKCDIDFLESRADRCAWLEKSPMQVTLEVSGIPLGGLFGGEEFAYYDKDQYAKWNGGVACGGTVGAVVGVPSVPFSNPSLHFRRP